MRFTVKAKLSCAFGAILVLSAVSGGISYEKLSEMSDNQTLLAKQGERLAKIGSLEGALWEPMITEKNMIIESDDTAMAALTAKLAEQRKEIARIEADLRSDIEPVNAKQLDQADTLLAQMYKTQDQVAAFSIQNSSNRAYHLWVSESLPLLNKLSVQLDIVQKQLGKFDASPELVRGTIEFLDTRSNWNRLTRIIAEIPSIAVISQLEEKTKDIAQRTDGFRTELTRTLSDVQALGVKTDDLAAAYDVALASALRVAAVARDAGSIKAQDLSASDGNRDFRVAFEAFDKVSHDIAERNMALAASAGENAKSPGCFCSPCWPVLSWSASRPPPGSRSASAGVSAGRWASPTRSRSATSAGPSRSPAGTRSAT